MAASEQEAHHTSQNNALTQGLLALFKGERSKECEQMLEAGATPRQLSRSVTKLLRCREYETL